MGLVDVKHYATATAHGTVQFCKLQVAELERALNSANFCYNCLQ